jgi:hypothetical protein
VGTHETINMHEIKLERNAVCKKALDDWANADLSSKQANCAVALSSIVNEIGILAITEKGRNGSEGLNLHGDNVTKQILASQSKRGNDVNRTTVSRVWNEHLAMAYELDPEGTVLLFDPAEVAQIVAEFRNGTRRLRNKPKKRGDGGGNTDKVFTFIHEVAKPMTKAKAVKTIKRIMGACGVSLSDLK